MLRTSVIVIVGLLTLNFSAYIKGIKKAMIIYSGADTTRPVNINREKNIDSNVVVYLDQKYLGTIRQIKNLDSLIPPDMIESMNILNRDTAIKKYGEAGKYGVIEIYSKKNSGELKEVVITDIAQPDKTDNKIFEKVDVEATFPGGETGWRRYLEKNLNANVPIEHSAPIGAYTVIVQFIVDKEGNISAVKPLTNHGYGMEEEVVKIITKGPKWIPASQNGRNVKAYRKQPVTFVVVDDQINITTQKDFTLFTKVDNTVTIQVNKIKNEDLEVTITQGKITYTGGSDYIVKVNSPGQAIIHIYKKKNMKEIGAVYFQVVNQ